MRKKQEHLGRDKEAFQVLTYTTSLGTEATGMQPHLDCGVHGQFHPGSWAIPDTGLDQSTSLKTKTCVSVQLGNEGIYFIIQVTIYH